MANDAGDLVLVPFSKYSEEEKKYVFTPFYCGQSVERWFRNNKSIFLAPLESTVKPLEIPVSAIPPSSS